MNDRSEGFEAVLEDLEGVVDSLEREELDLAEALLLFERGVERLRQAAALLAAAHGRVEELVEGASGDLEIIELAAPSGDEDDRSPDVEG